MLEAVRAVDAGVLVFYPYLYHPTVRGLPEARVPTLLYPAAHPELPFALPLFDEVFAAAGGVGFHTAPSRRWCMPASGSAEPCPRG
ncbi:MAG: hypothetical protein R2695_03475 [Acidimicrobiales bacterium]